MGGDAGRVVGLLRPVAAEVLERLPAEQEDLLTRGLRHQLGDELVVLGLRVEPVVEHLDPSVEGDVLRDDDAHGGLLRQWPGGACAHHATHPVSGRKDPGDGVVRPD